MPGSHSRDSSSKTKKARFEAQLRGAVVDAAFADSDLALLHLIRDPRILSVLNEKLELPYAHVAGQTTVDQAIVRAEERGSDRTILLLLEDRRTRGLVTIEGIDAALCGCSSSTLALLIKHPTSRRLISSEALNRRLRLESERDHPDEIMLILGDSLAASKINREKLNLVMCEAAQHGRVELLRQVLESHLADRYGGFDPQMVGIALNNTASTEHTDAFDLLLEHPETRDLLARRWVDCALKASLHNPKNLKSLLTHEATSGVISTRGANDAISRIADESYHDQIPERILIDSATILLSDEGIRAMLYPKALQALRHSRIYYGVRELITAAEKAPASA